jgi:hypothetical protein
MLLVYQKAPPRRSIGIDVRHGVTSEKLLAFMKKQGPKVFQV